jgi:3-hydroxyacyl-CoA dehydrogenase
MSGRNVFNEMVDWADSMALRGKLYPHDVTVSTEIARIVTGGDIEPGTQWTEQDLYDAERKAFLILVKSKPTQARIKSLLDDGKALRN